MTGPMAIIVRCLTCGGIAAAKVVRGWIEPEPPQEYVPVAQVRMAAWCRCGEGQ